MHKQLLNIAENGSLQGACKPADMVRMRVSQEKGINLKRVNACRGQELPEAERPQPIDTSGTTVNQDGSLRRLDNVDVDINTGYCWHTALLQ
jgi:hypothetical protein